MKANDLLSSFARLRFRRCLALVGGLFLAAAVPAQITPAQSPSPDSQETINLSPFTVTAQQDRGYASANALGATRVNIPIVNVPTSIVVLNEELLRDLGATDNLDAFRYVSGANENSLIYNGQLTIRGFQQGDGISFRDGLADNISVGGGPMNDFANIERVEVIKGPNGVLYGSHAPGGVANSITKKPLFTPRHEIKFVTGSWNLYRGEVDTTGPLGTSRKLAYRLVLMKQSGEVSNRGPMDKEMIAPSLTWLAGEKTRVVAQYMYYHPEIATSRNAWFADVSGRVSTFLPRRGFFDEDDEVREHWIQSSDVSIEHVFNRDWQMRLVARHTTADEDKFNYNKTNYRYLRSDGTPFRTTSGAAATYRNTPAAQVLADPNFGDIVVDRVRRRDLFHVERSGLFADVVGNIEMGPTKHKLITSVQSTRSETKDDQQWLWNYPSTSVIRPVYVSDPLSVSTNFRLTRNQSAKSDGFSYGFQDNISWSDRLYLVVGARHDTVDNSNFNRVSGSSSTETEKEWSYRASALYRFQSWGSVFANWSQTFLPLSGANELGVPFKNQVGEIKEAGFKVESPSGRLAGTFSVFDLKLDNFVRQILVDVSIGLVARIQSGYNRSQGWEADFTWQPIDELTLLAGVGDLTSEDEKGIAARGISQGLNWKALAKYSFRKGRLKGAFVGAGYVYNNRAAGDASATFFHPSYGLVDAFAGYAGEHWSIQVNGTNLADKFYASSVNDQFVSAGRPREYRITLGYRF